MPRILAATALLCATVIAPRVTAAQTSRAWDLCFTSGPLSCTQFLVTTTPTLVGGVRTGTLFDILVHHDQGAATRSGLSAFSFSYDSPLGAPVLGSGNGTDPAGGVSITPIAVNAPMAPTPNQWGRSAASSTTQAGGNLVALQNRLIGPVVNGAPAETQLIAGCSLGAQGAFDSFYRTTLQTCGAGSSYAFAFQTTADLDADRFLALEVDTYALLAGDAAGVTPYCTAYLNGAPSVGDDGQTFATDVCSVQTLVPTLAPEPPGRALLGAGLLGLAIAWRRRRPSPLAA